MILKLNPTDVKGLRESKEFLAINGTNEESFVFRMKLSEGWMLIVTNLNAFI